MTLHEAIVQVLTQRGSSNAKAIADAINEQRLYFRGDGKPVPVSQVSARINKHPDLFITEFRGLYQLKSKRGQGSIDYANLFYQAHQIFKPESAQATVNFVIWIAHILGLRQLLENYGSYEERSTNEYFKQSSLLLNHGEPAAFKECLSFFCSNYRNSSLPASFPRRFINNIDIDKSAQLSAVIQKFNFESENQYKILSAARSYITLHDRYATTPQYLKDLLDALARFFIARPNTLNLFTEVTPLIGPPPRPNNGDYFLQTYNEEIYTFLTLCKDLGEGYKEIFFCPPEGLLKKRRNSFQSITTRLLVGHMAGYEEIFPYARTYGNRTDLVYIEVILELLTEKGIAFVVVPQSLVSSPNRWELALRNRLIDADYVEAVISLPKVFLPYSGYETSLLILNKSKVDADKQKVYFVNAKTGTPDSVIGIHPDDILELLSNKPEGEDFKTASLNEIIERDCSLDPARYILPIENELIQLRSQGITVAKLSSVLSEFKLPSSLNEGQIPFVKIANLKNSETEFQLKATDIVHIESSTQRGVIVSENLLLAAKVGDNLKPTWLVPESKKVSLSPNIAAFRVDEEKILPEYLISELHSDLFKKQYSSILTGVAQPVMKPGNLLNLYIKLPTIEEQEQRLREKLELLHKLKQAEADRIKERLHYKETEYSIVSSVRHSLASQFGGMRADVDSLYKVLSRIIENGEQLTWETRLTPATTLTDIFQRLNIKLLDAQMTFDRIQGLIELNRRELNFERTDIAQFIAKCLQDGNYFETDADFVISFGSKKDMPIFADVDRFLLRELIRNLVENSLKHGKREGEKIPILIIVNGNPNEQKMVTIEYKDLGKGLPEGFTYSDYLSFGKRSGISQGTGIGGYIVSEIVKMHSGVIKPLEKMENELSTFGLYIALPFNQNIE